MSNHRAVALDGWRVTEMKQLPRSILALAADLYQDIEKNGVWPQNNCFAISHVFQKPPRFQTILMLLLFLRPLLLTPDPSPIYPPGQLPTVGSDLKNRWPRGATRGCPVQCTVHGKATRLLTRPLNCSSCSRMLGFQKGRSQVFH